MTKINKPLFELTKEDLEKVKLIVFDVDGVLVPRGTKIKQRGDILTLQTKVVKEEQINQIKKLHQLGFQININSGRGLYLLQKMFSDVLDYVSLTYENGSATWYQGKIYQHINSFRFLKELLPRLKMLKDKNIKGFEPKEFIITIHCKKQVKKIETIVARQKNLYALWNNEAYDIGIKQLQTKARGLKAFMKINKLKKENILAIGDNYNDRELLDTAGIAVTADKFRVSGDFYIPLSNKKLPAKQLMGRLIEVVSNIH